MMRIIKLSLMPQNGNAMGMGITFNCNGSLKIARGFMIIQDYIYTLVHA